MLPCARSSRSTEQASSLHSYVYPQHLYTSLYFSTTYLQYTAHKHLCVCILSEAKTLLFITEASSVWRVNFSSGVIKRLLQFTGVHDPAELLLPVSSLRSKTAIHGERTATTLRSPFLACPPSLARSLVAASLTLPSFRRRSFAYIRPALRLRFAGVRHSPDASVQLPASRPFPRSSSLFRSARRS